MPDCFKPIRFPQDELPHNKIIEWWYFNGHLWDEHKNHYAFMYAFFKADLKRVKLPWLKILPVKNIYFEHSMISDVKNNKFQATISPFCLLLPKKSKRPLLSLRYLGQLPNVSFLKETKPFSYRLKTKNLDLTLTSAKKPLLENQTGFIKLKPGRETWYYSLTDLAASGEIRIGKKTVKVAGQSWHDHQWADAPYENDYWLWFSVQLENGMEIICFEYGWEIKKRLATVMYKNCAQKTFDVEIIPGKNSWTSPQTGASYPQEWEIIIPKGKIKLVVNSLNKNQEMIYGLINYWEGGLSVKAEIAGEKIKGLGFAELVGLPAAKNLIEIFSSKFKREFDRSLERLKIAKGRQ
ncbi:MAG: hypothetical protein A3J65_01890 [Candidatus Buchananbacteria bacterium RIFCSPHIGHO2_02_FULL_45_11b]|uniref:AttH domain-containing protein n=2 Tax=Candidatus Buchananiibacteriota TaxID=1817903 RepID=A0A1G1YLZ8_9BACT|nr:MAG: hypothetical protein A2663_00225 [Candidatus Buchananbacteria bacterium RIFCSPHIGHO2_01_FULL_46_12]OGY52477.1 MAG: hypothetical protein A3J65_01890 [Candidatus Buchananbacteria bacterium RIFCSPHIGHO2_02_FULL_45_11b]